MKNPITSKIAGDYAADPTSVELSQEANELIEAAFADLPSGQAWDYHVHMLGLGTQGTGCWVNPEVRSWLHPIDKTEFNLAVNASGIDDLEKADEQYLQRLLTLARYPKQMKLCILAMDKCYNSDGSVNEADTKFYVPNEYVVQLSQNYPDVFVPCISVHPYRPDTIEELDKWAEQGVKMLKWMPSTQGMDASDPKCDPFYEKMKQHGMVLLTHTGKEDIMPVLKFMPLCNPLLFRRALDRGVKVIMAHCGSLGSNPDIDSNSEKVGNKIDFFFRLMAEPQYEGLLFGDIAALSEIIRSGSIVQILQKKGLHHRLFHGSDYPLPAINATTSTELLVKLGCLKKEQSDPLSEIYHMNPLLFDFVLKRTLRNPENQEEKFPASMFGYNPVLGLQEG